MYISIFIPTGSRAQSLQNTLRSLTSQTYRNFEVIVVDYKSMDGTHEVLKKFSRKLRIKLLHQTQKGLAKAANMALKIAKGEIFIRTDDDVIMDKGWLQAIVMRFKLDRTVGGVTGPTIIPASHKQYRDLFAYQSKFKKSSLLWRIIGVIYFQIILENDPYRVSHWFKSGAFSLGSNFPKAKKLKACEVDNLEACNLSVRTKILRSIGGFSERYGTIGDYHEADTAMRIKNSGYKLIFDPKASLQHLPSRDGFYNDRPGSYDRTRNFMIFYLTFIKPNTLDKFLRFSLYVLFMNAYYLYTVISLRQWKQLGAVPGTLAGVLEYTRNKN